MKKNESCKTQSIKKMNKKLGRPRKKKRHYKQCKLMRCCSEKFINDSNRRLLDQYSYTSLREDQTLHHNEMVDDLIKDFKIQNLISKNWPRNSKALNQKRQNFSFHQKHKTNKTTQ